MPPRFVPDPAASALSQEHLKRIDKRLQAWVDDGRVPCAQIAIWRGDALGHWFSTGQRDRERALPVMDDTIFRIYSMSKPIASIALMQLHEQGRVMLEDPVSKYIPEWAGLSVYVAGEHPTFVTRACDRPMTVHDLLTHQSGLTYGFMLRTNVDAAYRKLVGRLAGQDTLRDMALTLSELPLEFSPGSAWNYSVSTDIVGYLVEVISGQPLDQYLKQQIFDPLDMKDTGFVVPDEKVDRFAANYSAAAGKPLELAEDPRKSAYTGNVTMFSGGGGLVSTAADYLRFCRMLLEGGSIDGARIIGRKTLDLMATNHLTGGRDMEEASFGPNLGSVRTGMGFGLGFSVVLDEGLAKLASSRGEFAWAGAASTHFWVDPSEDLTVVFMTQLMSLGPSTLGRELRAMVYGALE